MFSLAFLSVKAQDHVNYTPTFAATRLPAGCGRLPAVLVLGVCCHRRHHIGVFQRIFSAGARVPQRRGWQARAPPIPWTRALMLSRPKLAACAPAVMCRTTALASCSASPPSSRWWSPRRPSLSTSDPWVSCLAGGGQRRGGLGLTIEG